jgi:hypothetical protein
MVVEELIHHLPVNEKRLTMAIRDCILQTAPMLQEKISYGVPFYYKRSRICFIWPASVPNGGLKEGILVGFCKGFLMANEEGVLQANGRKEVLTVNYLSLPQINRQLVTQWIQEALIIDSDL